MENVKVPATILLVGKRFTGKSYMLRWMLKELNDRFDYGYLISPTAFTGDWNCFPKHRLRERLNESFIEQLLLVQRRLMQQGHNTSTYLAIDDGLGTVDFRTKAWMRLAATARQYQISLFVVTQRFLQIPPVLRDNSDYIIVFVTTGNKMREAIYDTYVPSGMSRAAFYRLLDEATVDRGALMIDNKNPSNMLQATHIRAPSDLDSSQWKLNFRV